MDGGEGRWLEYAIGLQSLAQAGLYYTYDALPDRDTHEQIKMCFKAASA